MAQVAKSNKRSSNHKEKALDRSGTDVSRFSASSLFYFDSSYLKTSQIILLLNMFPRVSEVPIFQIKQHSGEDFLCLNVCETLVSVASFRTFSLL